VVQSKQMEHWEESELFGEGYLTKRAVQPAAKVVRSTSSQNESEEVRYMQSRLPLPMMALGQDAPPLWRCNARKKHYPEGTEVRELMEKAPTIHACMCVLCMLENYPYLEEGPPWLCKEEFNDVLEVEFVGLYEPAGYDKARPRCVECGEPIKIDGKMASKFRHNDEEIIHVTCLSVEDALALNTIAGGAYALPYLVRRRPEAQPEETKEEECDDREE